MKILLLFQVIVCILLLQGCVAATIISTAAVSTKMAIDPRTLGRQIDDSNLELRINKVILKNEKIKRRSRISATVYHGKTLLVGQAPTPWLIFYIKQIIMGIKGITEIHNEIRQSRPISFDIILSDIWITTKIRLLLFSNKQIKFSNIKVITENSEVFLLGLVTEDEGRVLTNIISNVKGVKRVTTVFSYVNR